MHSTPHKISYMYLYRIHDERTDCVCVGYGVYSCTASSFGMTWTTTNCCTFVLRAATTLLHHHYEHPKPSYSIQNQIHYHYTRSVIITHFASTVCVCSRELDVHITHIIYTCICLRGRQFVRPTPSLPTLSLSPSQPSFSHRNTTACKHTYTETTRDTPTHLLAHINRRRVFFSSLSIMSAMSQPFSFK